MFRNFEINNDSATLYDCYRGFNAFVNEFMNEHVISNGDKHDNAESYKISMNGS